jgi:kynureninase
VEELCARHGKRIVLIDQFAMGPTFERAEGMRGFQIAEAVISTIAHKAALGTELMVRLHDAWLAPLGFELATPRDPTRRGGPITLRHPDIKRIAAAMRDVVASGGTRRMLSAPNTFTSSHTGLHA